MTGRERHHAVDVLRLRAGAQVMLFDGSGLEARANVVEIGDDEIVFELAEAPHAAPHTVMALTLAVAAPKGTRGDWLVEKCAEFGVSRLVFIDCERGEVNPGEGKLARWRRKAVEAAKQAGTASVMEIESDATIEKVARHIAPTTLGLYGATRGDAPALYECLVGVRAADSGVTACVCFIGPEGGLTDAEIEALHAQGARPMSLGASTLRVETAAIAVAAIWAAYFS